MSNARIKRDDLVVVITGKDKGTQGRVLRFTAGGDRVVVEGVNKVKRHQSPQKFREGGIIEREAAIHISNVQPVDPETQKPTRVSSKVEDGKKVRVAKSGAKLD